MRKNKIKKINEFKGTMCGFENPHNSSQFVHVVIYENDRRSDVPHIHLEVDGRTIACLSLEDAVYFDHGFHRDTELSDDVLHELNRVMTQPSTIYDKLSLTNYQACVLVWNGFDINKKPVDKNTAQPDYITTSRR